MIRVVVDASVAIKWFFRSRPGEGDVAQALDVLRDIAAHRIALFQPAHFVAEVAAVLARETPRTAPAQLRELLDIESTTVSGTAAYARAMALASRHGQHLFDTLYHAVALEVDGACLLTADDRYASKAKASGRVVRLADYASPVV